MILIGSRTKGNEAPPNTWLARKTSWDDTIKEITLGMANSTIDKNLIYQVMEVDVIRRSTVKLTTVVTEEQA